MRVLAARPVWYHTKSTHPDLELLVDVIPGYDELRFGAVNGLWFAECDGYVRFFAHPGNGLDHGGYGGASYHLTLLDGSVVELVGPWSSRCAIMNEHFTHSMECSITDDERTWDRGFTFRMGAITVELAEQVTRELCSGVYVVSELISGERRYGVSADRVLTVKGEHRKDTMSCRYCL